MFDLENDPNELHNLANKKTATLKKWRQRMVEHLTERVEGFVKDGKLVQRKETMLYSPNYPTE